MEYLIENAVVLGVAALAVSILIMLCVVAYRLKAIWRYMPRAIELGASKVGEVIARNIQVPVREYNARKGKTPEAINKRREELMAIAKEARALRDKTPKGGGE